MQPSAADTRNNNWWVLGGFILVCMGVGGLAGWATSGSIDGWYRTITKPDWTPPDWAFGPAWTVLYIAMAVAAWRVWRVGARHPAEVKLALVWFWIQLALNFAWSFLFFTAQSPALAFVEIVFFWIAIVVTMFYFWRIDQIAGVLFVPYIAWVSFAGALNFAIWMLN